MQDEITNDEIQNLIESEEINLQNDGILPRDENIPPFVSNNELEKTTTEFIPPVENKIEKRGRHKKDCECDKCKSKKDGIAIENNTDKSENNPPIQNSKISNTNPLDLSEFKKTEINANSQNETEVNAVKYITGSLLLMLIDAVAPTVLIKLLGMADPKYKNIKSKNVRLSKDQKEDLEPLANEAVKQMTINMNPMTAFFVCTSLIYATNIMSSIDE